MTSFATRSLSPALSALALTLLLPGLALADDLVGNYELNGIYSSRRTTSLKVRVEAAGYQKYRVERRARFTSATYRHLPEFVWTSEPGELHGNLLVVRYQLGSDASSIAARIAAGANDDAVLNALQTGNEVRAIYTFSADRSQIREVALNVTKRGDQTWWSWIKTRGRSVNETFRPTTAAGRLSSAAFNRKTDEAIKTWYLEYIREGYESELADASSEAERRRIRERWDADKDQDPTDMVQGSELYDDSIDDRYDSKRYYRDSQGRAIPREDVVAYEFSFFTDLAGIGLSKVLIFDRHTGEIIDEGELQD